MSHKDPKNGVDYLVDHYAILEVARTATQEEIKTAWKEKTKGHHPDLFQRVAKEYQVAAEFKIRLINEAHDILEDSEKRKKYDELLLGWTGPISKDGIPVLRGLGVRGDSPEEEATLRAIIEQARVSSGFNADVFEMVEEVYESTKNPTAKQRAAYQKALAQKDLALSLEESFLGEAVGLGTQIDPSPPMNYLEHRALVLCDQRDEIDRTARRSLESQKAQALLEGKSDNLPQLFIEHKELLAESFRVFDARAHKLLAIAKDREALIKKRVEVAECEYADPPVRYYAEVSVDLFSGGSSVNFSGRIVQKGKSSLAFEELDLSVIPHNKMKYAMEEGMPFHETFSAVIAKHYFRFREQEDVFRRKRKSSKRKTKN